MVIVNEERAWLTRYFRIVSHCFVVLSINIPGVPLFSPLDLMRVTEANLIVT
jgi:hypothetical protein